MFYFDYLSFICTKANKMIKVDKNMKKDITGAILIF